MQIEAGDMAAKSGTMAVTVMPESFAKEAMLAWFRTEFAAANAIVDVLCSHLTEVHGGAGEYAAAFHEIHRRRMNWIPVLHMQKYHAVGEIVIELRRVAAEKKKACSDGEKVQGTEQCENEVEDSENAPKRESRDEKIDVTDSCLVDDAEASEADAELRDSGAEEVESENERNEEAVDYSSCLDGEKARTEEEPRDSGCDEVEKTGAAVDPCLEAEKAKDETSSGTYSGDHDEVSEEYNASPNCEVTDSGSQDVQFVEHVVQICDDHGDCEARQSQIKLTKGFNAKESVKSHMVNVVKGLKLYEDVFTEDEISKLRDCVLEMRDAGLHGELLGETYMLFNQQMKGNKKELIQLGVPLFSKVSIDDAVNHHQTLKIEPIPTLLENVIDHFLQWGLIPEYKRPNGCIINFYEEGEYSQPFQKPPHLDQPISTLVLTDSTMAFGRILSSDNDGNYKGALMLSLKEGSLLVMRGNSSDMARHVICPSTQRRINIAFFRVRPEPPQCRSPTSPLSAAVPAWQPSPYAVPYEADMAARWGGGSVLPSPLIMLAPPAAVPPAAVIGHRRAVSPPGGTGVFLPWAMAARKPQKHLPPRAQKGRLMAALTARACADAVGVEAGGKPAVAKLA